MSELRALPAGNGRARTRSKTDALAGTENEMRKTMFRQFENRLLDHVGAAELEPLLPHLERVTLALGEPLVLPHRPITHVWFPITALGSLVAILEDGSTVESGSVGREGMVGIPVLLDARVTPMQTVTQIGGEAYRVPAPIIKEAYDRRGPLHVTLNRYVHALFVIASQSAACNRKHHIEARLCRWLLMSSDGIGSDEVAITQEFLAVMLGVRRSGVTEAALKIQEAGVIAYSRGLVKILDRRRLEEMACSCYRVIQDEFGRIFAP